jgi:glutaredoxin
MKYKVFTLPTCKKCPEVKDYLKQKLDGQEIDLKDPEGLKELRKYYVQVKDKMPPRDEHGNLPLPIVLFFDEQDNITEVANSIEQVQVIVK